MLKHSRDPLVTHLKEAAMSKDVDKTINRHGDSRNTKAGPKSGGRRPRNLGIAASVKRPVKQSYSLRQLVAVVVIEELTRKCRASSSDKLFEELAATVACKAARVMADRDWKAAYFAIRNDQSAGLTAGEKVLAKRMFDEEWRFWFQLFQKDPDERRAYERHYELAEAA